MIYSNTFFWFSSSDFSKYLNGDATQETAGWYKNHSTFLTNGEPFFVRGGLYNEEDSGIFSVHTALGDANKEYTTRIVSITYKNWENQFFF